MMEGFRKFIMRGNVVDLAVAVVIGAAFGTLVSSAVKDLITPLIAAVVGRPDFSALAFTINGSRFTYGNFINALLSFLLVAAAVYYFIVVPMNLASRRFKSETPTLRKCPECLSDMPLQARKCAACGSGVALESVPRTGTF